MNIESSAVCFDHPRKGHDRIVTPDTNPGNPLLYAALDGAGRDDLSRAAVEIMHQGGHDGLLSLCVEIDNAPVYGRSTGAIALFGQDDPQSNAVSVDVANFGDSSVIVVQENRRPYILHSTSGLLADDRTIDTKHFLGRNRSPYTIKKDGYVKNVRLPRNMPWHITLLTDGVVDTDSPASAPFSHECIAQFLLNGMKAEDILTQDWFDLACTDDAALVTIHNNV